MDIFSRACVDHALQFLQTALVAAPVARQTVGRPALELQRGGAA